MIWAKAWITSNILPYQKKNVEHLHFHGHTPEMTNEDEKNTMIVMRENERRKIDHKHEKKETKNEKRGFLSVPRLSFTVRKTIRSDRICDVGYWFLSTVSRPMFIVGFLCE
jgi:hypothetical protein